MYGHGCEISQGGDISSVSGECVAIICLLRLHLRTRPARVKASLVRKTLEMIFLSGPVQLPRRPVWCCIRHVFSDSAIQQLVSGAETTSSRWDGRVVVRSGITHDQERTMYMQQHVHRLISKRHPRHPHNAFPRLREKKQETCLRPPPPFSLSKKRIGPPLMPTWPH